jgi:hypothetical protein
MLRLQYDFSCRCILLLKAMILHMEVVCQAPVTSTSILAVGNCKGYNGPNFKPLLPKIGQHVMVTGRYQIEMPEMPGGITELHPVYGIKILP